MVLIRVKTFLFVLLLISYSNFAQNKSDVTNKIYNYPVKPGTSEWKLLKSHSRKVDVCQIPENVLKKMSTQELIETCIEYPLLGDMFAYDNLNRGFKRVFSGFNGLQELFIRENAGKFLLEKYKNMSPGLHRNNITKGKHTFQFIYIEMILSQDPILFSLSKTDQASLLKESLTKFYEKRKNKEFNSKLSQTSNALLMAKIIASTDTNINRDKTLTKNLKRFIETNLLDEKMLNEILQIANKLTSF